jgi:hypothetical protein
MKLTNILIIVFLLVVFYIGYNLVSTTSKVEDKKINPSIPKMCFGDNCMPTSDCSILNPATITKCETSEDGKKICNSCICQANSNLTGCMTCQESDPDSTDDTKVYKLDIPQESCKDPLFWDSNDNTCKLSKGSYCLPKEMIDVSCNKYTGRKLLKKGDNGYEWTCVCKNDTKFSGDSCTDINICSMLGSSANPNNNKQRGLIRKGTTNDFWQPTSNWDPNLEGECKCSRQGEVPDNNRLICARNECMPGSFDDSDDSRKTCICPDGFVDCKDLSIVHDKDLAGIIDTGLCRIPSCVPDPCGGPESDPNIGTYNSLTNNCECKPPYTLVNDPYSILGVGCKKLCVDNGPCGVRGTCKMNTESVITKFLFQCSDIDGTGICSGDPYTYLITYEDPSQNTYYLTYDIKNNDLVLEITGKNDSEKTSFFNFELKQDDDNGNTTLSPLRTGGTRDLHPKFSYYIKIGNKYLNLVKPNLVDSSKKELSLFRLGNKENPSKNNFGNIFITYNNQYLSVNSTTQKLNYVPISASTNEYCDNCDRANGWKEDENNLCAQSCIPEGQWSRWHSGSLSVATDDYKSCCWDNIAEVDSKDIAGLWYENPILYATLKLAYPDGSKFYRFKCGGGS